MIGDDSDSNIDVDSGAHFGSPEFRFKIMSYSGEQIRMHLWSRGMQSVFNFIADNYQAEEVKELTDSEFIDIKSITDGLSEVKILSKFYDCLGLDSSKLGIQYPPENSSISSVCSEEGSSNTELIKKSLLKRNKNEKLSDNQIKFLRDQIDYSGLSFKEISSRFFVSPSNLRRIRNLTSAEISKGPVRPSLKLHDHELHKLKREIKFYSKNWVFPFTIGDVKQYLDDTNNQDNPYVVIRKVMINDLNMSFKLCKSRSSTFNITKIKASHKLFRAYFAQRLEPSTLIINVDESVFSRTSKINYSWSTKGVCAELKTLHFQVQQVWFFQYSPMGSGCVF